MKYCGDFINLALHKGDYMIPYKKNNINYVLTKEAVRKDQLIKIISRSSSRYGDKLLDFMDQYKLNRLKDANAKQLEEYIKNNDLR
jgi:hypothetical protein